MNNCLVTKLKETVDNDNLLIYGVLKLKVSSNTDENNYFHFYVEDDSEVTMTIESDDENDYFMDFYNNKIGKTITAVKNQLSDSGSNAFRIHGCIGKTLIINDPNYKFKKLRINSGGFYQYGKSLEEDFKFREMSSVLFSRDIPELICNIKKLIKNTNNEPYNIELHGSEDVVYDDIKVLAYCFSASKTSKNFDALLHSSFIKTIIGKRDILQIIAVRRYLGNTEGEIMFTYPQQAYLGDTPLSSFGSFVYIKFTWTEDTVKVYTAGNDNVYSEVATINNSDRYDWE